MLSDQGGRGSHSIFSKQHVLQVGHLRVDAVWPAPWSHSIYSSRSWTQKLFCTFEKSCSIGELTARLNACSIVVVNLFFPGFWAPECMLGTHYEYGSSGWWSAWKSMQIRLKPKRAIWDHRLYHPDEFLFCCAHQFADWSKQNILLRFQISRFTFTETWLLTNAAFPQKKTQETVLRHEYKNP